VIGITLQRTFGALWEARHKTSQPPLKGSKEGIVAGLPLGGTGNTNLMHIARMAGLGRGYHIAPKRIEQ
jgi:hypothetical protein